MKRRLILFTGMGGDSRLMSRVRVDGVELVAPDHETALPAETLAAHAERLARKYAVGKEDVVGGVSFGGMLAAQIASAHETAGLILLGSCLNADWIPTLYRAVEAASPLIPDLVLGLRTWTPLIRWRFAPIDDDSLVCVRSMAKDCPTRQLRTFGRMVVGWKGAGRPSCPMLIVHGDRDRIIPISAVEPDVIIAGAGHAFTLTHPDETNRALSDFFRRSIREPGNERDYHR